MTTILDLTNPPDKNQSPEQDYRFKNSVNDVNTGLSFIMNPSVLNNANFATLGSSGTTPVTQAAGDGAQISSGWNVFGASNATYSMTSTAYPSNSLIQSSSAYYEHVQVSSHNGQPFYIYQRQSGLVRKYQNNFLIYGLIIKNNQSSAKKVRMDITTHYDGSSDYTANGAAIYLQPGINTLSSLIQTQSLNGLTVGAGNYTDFRLNFIDLYDGTADLEIYQIKCEFGKVSTLLQQ